MSYCNLLRQNVSLDQIVGMTFDSVVLVKDDPYMSYNDSITFENKDVKFIMSHDQDCCEHVYLSEYDGDLEWLVGSPITQVDVSTSGGDQSRNSGWDDLVQWTFYRISTVKGTVHMRWNGSSNGYYSVDVDVYCINK